MKYDPFVRGQYPVGVRTLELTDPARAERALPVEIWYPAATRHRGQDLQSDSQDTFAIFGLHRVRQAAVRDADPAGVPGPLLIFSHGLAGHRRQSTFLCTHLASHGYVVAAPDHGGSTLADLIALAMRIGHGVLPAEAEAELLSHALDCPRDVQFLLGALREPRVVPLTEVAGVLGHSFGGFTALATAGDARVHAVAALAPAGGEGPLESPLLTRALALDWPPGSVSTLVLAMERDSVLPLAGIEALFRRTPKPDRMFVLPGGDHMHLCDRAASSHEFFRRVPPVGIFAELLRRMPPFTELASEAHGYAFANGLCLAHFDAALRSIAEADDFLTDAVAQFTARGLPISALQ